MNSLVALKSIAPCIPNCMAYTNMKCAVDLQINRCVCITDPRFPVETDSFPNRVQVNLSAESGEMGVLANHVPSIEQLKPGLIEIVEESGGSKQFFRESQPPQKDQGTILIRVF